MEEDHNSVGISPSEKPSADTRQLGCEPSSGCGGGVIHASADQFDRLLAAIEADKRASVKEMPTERDALKVMFQAWERLKALGWREAIYCPKDGTTFDAIEAGSAGIHDCHYEGEWPNGSWWVSEAGDLWPAHPTLFRLKPGDADATTPASVGEGEIGGEADNSRPNQESSQ